MGSSDPADFADSARPELDAVERPTVPRRRVLGGAAWAGLAGAAVGAAGGGFGGYAMAARRTGDPDQDTVDLRHSYPFYGQRHQGGIATPPQRYAMFMSFALAAGAARADLQALLARWSAAAAVLQRGSPVGSVQPSVDVQPPTDTGEAYGLSPASLTVTIGLGPGVFGDRLGGDRFGLAGRRPAAFTELPALNGDNLDPRLHGGDLSVQACADDPQVCYHAARALARLGRDVVSPFWAVLGFGRASAGPGQHTPRNLMGFKDGTRNVSTDAEYARFVWVENSDQPWMNGGTYQVVRKIRMLLETWDVDRIGHQQKIFGRTKQEGAPLGGKAEFDIPDFAAAGAGGDPLIDPLSHVALAARENNDGIMIRRRPYNYTDGLDSNGQLNAGLLFVSYQNDPQHFIQLQNRLGAHDLLNEYIRHVGSAMFAVPPAPAEGHYIGQGLFG
jgi:deferrochelatase/peroxidase EfeB